jgi:hypothetical protein
MCCGHAWQRVGRLAVLLGGMAGAAAASTADAPKLRYDFKAGQEYAYEVKIHAEIKKVQDTREGVLTYNVTSATDEQIVMKQTGMLRSHLTGSVLIGPPRLMGPPQFATGPQTISINRSGKMLVANRELTPLPYLLGQKELLLLEEFPDEAKNTWDKQRDILVKETKSNSRFGHRGPPHASDTDKTERGGQESAQYTVTDARPNIVVIRKTFKLSTSEEADHITRFDMSGEGEFTFDRTAGVIRSISMKYDIHVNEKNETLNVPVTVDCKLLTAQEVAEHQRREEEKLAAAQAMIAKATASKPFERGERNKLLADLRSTDKGRAKSAAERLATVPVDDRPGDFAKPLAVLLAHSNEWGQEAAAKALAVWAAPEAEAALIEASKSKNMMIRGPSLKALGKLRSKKAAEAVAGQMYRKGEGPAKALKEMGPVAEEAAIACLKDRDEWVRKEACGVLAEIGGEKSIQALSEYASHMKNFAAKDANNAIDSIRRRLAEGNVPAAAEKPEQSATVLVTSAQTQFRTWRDATGSFEIEAVLVSYENKTVTLKRKDGKIVPVPFEKLSKADQKYLAEYDKAGNPFE